MTELITTIKEWQELVGAILGGIFAFMVAFIVADQSKREERQRAGLLISTDLMSIMAAYMNLRDGAIAKNITLSQYPRFFAQEFVRVRPTLSPLFESSMLVIMTSDKLTARHLTEMMMAVRAIEPCLQRLANDIENASLKIKVRARAAIDRDAVTCANAMEGIQANAFAAQHYIENIIFSRFPTYYKLKREFFPSEEERKYMKFLTTGISF